MTIILWVLLVITCDPKITSSCEVLSYQTLTYDTEQECRAVVQELDTGIAGYFMKNQDCEPVAIDISNAQ